MNTTKEYLLLFRGGQWDKGLSPEQLQQSMDQFMGWFERLKAEGKCKGGQPLEREGKIVSGKNGRTVADGPFAESKEAIGGYFLLTVDSLEEAVDGLVFITRAPRACRRQRQGGRSRDRSAAPGAVRRREDRPQGG